MVFETDETDVWFLLRFGLSMDCDIKIASNAARFTRAYTSIGLTQTADQLLFMRFYSLRQKP